jgi:hypothetical protein
MVDWCSKYDGVYLMNEEAQTKVLDLVNSAVDVVELSVKMASKMLWLIMPGSARAFLVWDGAVYIPLQGLFKKYWKLEVRIGRTIIYEHVLPHQPIGDIVRAAIEPFNADIAGSEDWYYRDFDGAIRMGKNCTPPRGYKQITDSASDLGILLLIIGILSVLNNAGLYDWSSKLLSKAMTYLRNKKIMSRISNTLDLTEDIKTGVDNMDADTEYIKEKVNTIGRNIGVRLAIR